jgi:hypothetical protein
MYLDDIVFSAVPIPEPATWMLLSLAGLAVVGMMRRRR